MSSASNLQKPSVLSLLGANALVMILALILEWSLFDTLLVFCVESIIIGVINVPKMILVLRAPKMSDELKDGQASEIEQLAFLTKLFVLVIRFFFILFGSILFTAFCFIQLLIIKDFFYGNGIETLKGIEWSEVQIDWSSFTIGVIIIALSHLISFMTNFVGKKEYLNTKISRQIFAPFRRVLLVILVIISAGFVIRYMGIDSPWAVIPFFVIKTFFDLRQHNKEHSKSNLQKTELE